MISNLKNILPLLKQIIATIYRNREELEKYVKYLVEIYVTIAKAAKKRQKGQTKKNVHSYTLFEVNIMLMEGKT